MLDQTRGRHFATAHSHGRAVNPVDVYVGQRVRIRRKAMRLSQQNLADELGLTFQQVQKYERGDNRISASKLYEISRFLGVPVGYFFEGLDENGPPDQKDEVHDFAMSVAGIRLLVLGSRANPAVVTQINKLLETVIEETSHESSNED